MGLSRICPPGTTEQMLFCRATALVAA